MQSFADTQGKGEQGPAEGGAGLRQSPPSACARELWAGWPLSCPGRGKVPSTGTVSWSPFQRELFPERASSSPQPARSSSRSWGRRARAPPEGAQHLRGQVAEGAPCLRS